MVSRLGVTKLIEIYLTATAQRLTPLVWVDTQLGLGIADVPGLRVVSAFTRNIAWVKVFYRRASTYIRGG